MNFNPHRRPRDPAPARSGEGLIEQPDDCFYNMPWQTREREPTDYELELAAALSALFEQGQHELADIVAGLGASSVRMPTGEPWTEESFVAEIRRLGR